MDALSRISELYDAELLIDNNMFMQQHPEGVHPSPGAPVSIPTAHSCTPLTLFMTVTASVAVSSSLH